jgi:mTERF domain-containing protein
VDNLKKTFRWSHAEVSIAVSKAPILLSRSKDVLHRTSKFLISEVGLEPAYVVKFLKENRLLERNRSYYCAVLLTEELFVERYICPHKESAPHLAEDYADACRGEVPANFRFT